MAKLIGDSYNNWQTRIDNIESYFQGQDLGRTVAIIPMEVGDALEN